MTLVSRTNYPSSHRERSLSAEPTEPQAGRDHSPVEPDRSGSVSPSRQKTYNYARNGNSHHVSGQNHVDRNRYRRRDRSQDREVNRKYDGNRSRVQARDQDHARDDDLDERPPYEGNGRTGHDNDRGRYRARVQQQDRNLTNHYQRYRPRSNHNDNETGFSRDGNERRDYRPGDQSARRYSDRHQHFSYDRWTSNRQSDYSTRSRHQGQHYQSSSSHRRPYSPRAAPSPSKSPMRRPFDPRRSSMLDRNDDRISKRRKLDYRSHSRSRNRETGLTRSTTPSRSRSRTPSRGHSRSRSRSRARSCSDSRAKSRSSSHSNSTDLHYHPVRSPSPVPPQLPRPPKCKLRPTPVARECEVLAYDSLHSKSPSQSPRPPRRPRSFRSRTPPSEFSGSSLDGRPCDVTERSRSPRRSRSRSRSDNRRPRHRSISRSVVSGYSRTPFERRSISRSRSPRTSSDRRFSSSSRRPHRSLSRTCSSRGRSSSPRSPKRSRTYRRRRSIETDIGPPPIPPRPPIGPRFAVLDTVRQRRDGDRWYARESNRQRDPSPPPLPPSPPTQRPGFVNQTDLDGVPKASQEEVESVDPNNVPNKAPLPISPPPAIPQPPRSPKRLRPNVHAVRKAPGMPPTAPVAQTSAGVRRFFPGDDDDEDDNVMVPIEPMKLHPTLDLSDVEEAEIDPKPPSPSPPPLPPAPPSPPRFIQKSPSYHYLRQRNYRRLSCTPPLPPPPPPAAPPPTPPPLIPVETTHTTSTSFIAQDFTRNRRGTSRSRHSPRRNPYREEDSAEYFHNHSRRSSHRFSNRRDVPHAPPDVTTPPLPSTTAKDHRGTAHKALPTNRTMHSGHYNATHPPTLESHMIPPSDVTHYANNPPPRLLVREPSFQNYSVPPSASQTVEQPLATHQKQLQGIRPTQGASSKPQVVGPPPITNDLCESKEIYERLVQVGEGTYGKVYKARNIETSELVAMKRIRMESEKDGFPITAIREIKILQDLRHPNIVNLVEMVVSQSHVYIVFEYMDHDLSGVLHHPHIHFSEAHTKSLMWQLLCGLQYMHERCVLHRDLKGSNILLNRYGQLKIADFGLARRFERGKEAGCEGRGRGRDYTNRVITLWYKPPELLLGATVYGEEVDMWSAGVIFLELFTRRPIFQTGDEIDQLYATFKLMGTPTMTNWPEAFDLPWFELLKPKVEQPSRLRETFFGPEKNVRSEAGMALAERLLTLRPHDRPSAREALKSAYFTTENPPMELPTEILSNVRGEWHELESKRARRRRDI
ncbi:kinase subunit of RNA polymerase II carboxy-terminal domain kinase I [Puccinia graminis f. sp. tritici]|uniref:Kinase subunit of RNA polymerase II carboxy-terminal domain kinase I n=1 Tax=Puccinia graminis f. sp. tritici TaxID=56615 RepID=A0A5B0PJN5_PUCGR|nr:kinase subunit of RNA polymerase II carboxy-terminal domain kinase I [Puccinia graminis f. sp. tritici]